MTRRKQTNVTVGQVAPPRRFVPTGTYMGAELQRTSHRTGAYDAFSLPSKFGKQQAAPGAAPTAPVSTDEAPPAANAPDCAPSPVPAERRFFAVGPDGRALPTPGIRHDLKALITPAPSKRARKLTPTPRGVSLSPYVPHPGSTPSRVIAALQAEGGMISYAEISERFGVPPGSVTAVLKAALLKGALIRHLSEGRKVRLHLPGYVPPVPPPAAAAPVPTAAPDEIANIMAANSAQLDALANAYAKAFHEFSVAAAAASTALLAQAKELDHHMRAVSAGARNHVPPARRAS